MSDLAIHKHTLTRIMERLETAQKRLYAEAQALEESSKAADSVKKMSFKEHWKARAVTNLNAAMILDKEVQIIRNILL